MIRNYPGTRVYYVLSTTGNRLATVMFSKVNSDGRWCRGVALMSQEKGKGNRYDVNEGRRLAWKRLQAAVHSLKSTLPIRASHCSSQEFLDLTGGRIAFKSESGAALTPKEEAIVNAEKK